MNLRTIDMHLDSVDPLRILAFQSTIELLHITGHPTEPLSLFTSSLSSSPRARQQRNTRAGGPSAAAARDFAPLPRSTQAPNTVRAFARSSRDFSRWKIETPFGMEIDSSSETRLADRRFEFDRHS